MGEEKSKVDKAAKGEKAAKAGKSAKAGVEESKTPKGKGGGKGGEGKAVKSAQGKRAKSGKDANPSTPPSINPTADPTNNPTADPTINPTAGPTKNPTAGPTKSPTAGPTKNPTAGPTKNPTAGPTITPIPPTAGCDTGFTYCDCTSTKNECEGPLLGVWKETGCSFQCGGCDCESSSLSIGCSWVCVQDPTAGPTITPIPPTRILRPLAPPFLVPNE